MEDQVESMLSFPVIDTTTGFNDVFDKAFINKTLPYSLEYTIAPTYFERCDFIKRFGYFIPTMELIDVILHLNGFWLSIGCGRGYTEHIMRMNGINIISTDKYPIEINPYFSGDGHLINNYTNIELMDAEAAIKQYPDRHVFMSWASKDESWAFDACKNIQPGNYLIYAGDYKNVADRKFYRLLDTKFVKLIEVKGMSFNEINDTVSIYIKN